MKVLIADKFPIKYIDKIVKLKYQIIFNENITTKELINKIKGFNILIIRNKKITNNIIENSNCLKLIIRAGSGYDNIDILSANKKYISVCNVPGKNAIAVAELTIGLMLSIDRKIPDNVNDIKNFKWNKNKYSNSIGIFGRKLGIIGFGEIGQLVAKRAFSFGMKILVYDTNLNKTKHNIINKYNIIIKNDIYKLVKNSNIITLHIPSNKNTINIINKKILNFIKKDSIIINTSRSDIINEKDLICAMDNKNIKLGTDVYKDEPEYKSGYFKTHIGIHPNVYGTHHIGASTRQAQNSIASGVIKILKYFKLNKIINKIN